MKHISFCFGRFQPPHAGHRILMNTVKAQGGEYRIFASPTFDHKKNPLMFETKISFIRKMFPEVADCLSTDSSLNTIMKIATSLYNDGYTSVTFVAGVDRIDQFKSILVKYNGEAAAHGYYKFDNIEFVTSASPEVRGTQLRQSVIDNDFDQFAQLTQSGEYARELFACVQEGLVSLHK